MSRSPVREALIRLSGDDLVVTLSNRSTIVAPIDIQSFPTYVEALGIALRMNNRLAAERRTGSDLTLIANRQEEFKAAVLTGRHLDKSAANKAFHMAIAAAGRNDFLAAFYERLLDQGRRMLHLHFEYLERTRKAATCSPTSMTLCSMPSGRAMSPHDHTRQFRDSFLDFLQQSHARTMPLDTPEAGDRDEHRS